MKNPPIRKWVNECGRKYVCLENWELYFVETVEYQQKGFIQNDKKEISRIETSKKKTGEMGEGISI